MSAGAATAMAAALVLSPGTAVASPADEAAEAMQQAVDEAREAAEAAAQAAQDAAEAAQDAADQATKAAESAAEDAAENAENAVEDATDEGGEAADVVDGDGQVDWMTEDLRSDLEGLEDLSGDERAEELENIIRNAVTGDYGEEVENWTERMVDFMDVLPQDLQGDLQNVLGMQPEAAQDELRQIWEGVMDGDYGDDAQMWGTWLRGSFQEWNLGEIITGDMSEEPADGN